MIQSIFKFSRIIPISLSPRPDTFTITTSDFFIFGARFITSATACADSSAGMIPSVRARGRRRFERLRIRRRHILRSARIAQCRMLRPNRRIIQSRRHRMCQRNLPARILQHVRIRALQHARRSSTKPRRMIAQSLAAPARLHADQLHFLVFNEFVEHHQSHSIRRRRTQSLLSAISLPPSESALAPRAQSRDENPAPSLDTDAPPTHFPGNNASSAHS